MGATLHEVDVYQLLTLELPIILESTLIPGDRKQHVEKIYQFLLTPNLAATEADFYSLQGKRLEGSCQWVTQQTWFMHWQQGRLESQSDIIWLNGPPGTGKSVISTFIIDQIRQSGHSCYYYFFKSSDASKRSLERCLLSIAYQISLTERAVRDRLLKLHDTQFHLLGTELLLLWQKVFVASILPIYEVERLPLFLVLDGLDEAEDSHSIFSLLNTLRHLRYGLRLCVTSRPSVEFAHKFSRLGDQVRIATHRISAKDNIGDVTCLVEATLSGLPLSTDVRRQILDSVIQKAEGNILWVEMVSREMLEAGFNEESLLQVLQHVPPGMDQIYANTLARLKALPPRQEEIARWIILWTLSSFQPLRLPQLQEALQFGPPAEKVEALEHWLTKLCGNIVVVDQEKRVQPLHATAREFLLADTTTGYAITANTHLHIAKVCLESILKSNQFHNARKMQSKSKALENVESTDPEEKLAAISEKINLWTYAVFWWSDHLAAASSQDADLAVFELLTRVLKSPKFMDCIREIAESGDLHPLVRTAENLKRYTNCLDITAIAERKHDLKIIGSWASDLRRLTTEFGVNLVRFPSLANTIVPPFCPRSSAIYRRFGAQERGIVLLGDVSIHWDTRLALLNPPNTTSYGATTVSASSKLVAVGYQNGLITIWNSTTALLAHEVNLGVPVSCLTFSHTGSCIAAGGRESIKLWNPSTAVEHWQLALHAAVVPVLLEFSDDDSLLFAIFRCNQLQVYNLEDCSVIAEFDWGGEKLSTNIVGEFPLCVSLNSQRTRMAAAYRGFPVSIWDIEKKIYLKKIRLACHDLSHRLVQRGGKTGFTTYTHDSVQTIEYHSVTEELFLSYMDGTFVKWDPETNEQVTSPINVNIHVMKCSPDGTLVVTGNSLGQIQFWSSTTLELLFTLEDDGDAVRKLCLSTDGDRIFDVRGVYCNIWEPEILQQGARIYRETRLSLPTPSQKHSHSFTPTNFMSVTCLCPSPDGSYFIAGTDNGRVILYSMASGKRLKILYSHCAFAEITSISWSKDGQFLATGDNTSIVLVYRVTILDGRTEITTEPLQANYGDFEIDSDYDDSNFHALESALEITATEILRGSAKVAGRHDGLVNSLLLSENNDLLMVSTLSADSVWQLNESIEVQKKNAKVVDSCLTICYGSENLRQLQQHPQDTNSIMIIGPESVRILSWSAVRSKIKSQEQRAPLLPVDYNSLRDEPLPSEYNTSTETNSSERKIWELERSCLGVMGNHDVLVTCLSTPRVGQPGRQREISLWRIEGTSDNSIVNIRPSASLSTSDTAITIHSLLGISAGRIYFFDTNGCLCSQDINLEELTPQKKADVSDLAVWFCLPRGQVTPGLSSIISCAIVWNQDVVFARKEKVIVVKRGLRGQGIRERS